MKQLIQSVRTGKTQIWEVPAPKPAAHEILVGNRASVISSGTERAVVEFSRKSLWAKAQSRPDLVQEAIRKIRRDGIADAWEAVHSRLDDPLSLGYSSAGEVIAVGSSITEFRIGDRVACAGGGYASHAEVIAVPRTLAARIPELPPNSPRIAISFAEAAFSGIGSVALHALRLAEPQLGETVAVIGLGLIGQIAIQLVRAAGCRVIGIDPNAARCNLARKLGCDEVALNANELQAIAAEQTRGAGVDAIIIAAGSNNSEPLQLAAAIARDRARVIAIGQTGMEIPRKAFYEKELDFKVSRSYGPGRYDDAYEGRGQDYPLGYVRWTEGRNLGAFLDLFAQHKVNIESLISQRISISSAPEVYDLLFDIDRETLGVVIEYPGSREIDASVQVAPAPVRASRSAPIVKIGLLGAGNFARRTLLPILGKSIQTEMVAVCARTGVSAARAARKGHFRIASTDENHLISLDEVNAVVIATRHHLHASQVIASLRAGKHVFCEKPLCLHDDELGSILQAREDFDNAHAVLMVGFNRRFAPLAIELKEFLGDVREPLLMNYRVNAGYLPSSHWTQDPEQGGGRIIGEVCHFIDLMTFLCGSKPIEVFANATVDSGEYTSDNAILQLKFGNGSTGVITYAAAGDRLLGKERLEVFAQGKSAVLDDFRSLELIENGQRRVRKSWWRADKGHAAEWKAFERAVLSGGPEPIPIEEIVTTTLATFRLMDSLRGGKPEVVQLRSAAKKSAAAAN